jgi:arylsulfatase A-like enzyme
MADGQVIVRGGTAAGNPLASRIVSTSADRIRVPSAPGAALLALLALLACAPAAPPARVVDGIHRVVEEIEPDDPGKEVKARAGDEYRNVLFEPGSAEPASEYRTQPLVLPARARLDFGMAIEGDAGPERRAHFTLEAEREGERIALTSREVRGDAGWVDARVDLAELAGEEVRLLFRAEPLGAGEAAETRPLWGNPLLVAGETGDVRRGPSLILISLDTLRADHLGAWGYARETSPNLDAFMREGLVFERAIAPSSWTTPSHATLLTGEHPSVHGAGSPLGHRLQSRFTTLAELLRGQGHLTAAFTEGAAVAGQLGFHQGFDSYANGCEEIPHPQGAAEQTFARATEWLERHGDRPFLLFVHTYEIHWPYRSPAPYSDLFQEDGADRLDPHDAQDTEFLRKPLTDAQKAGVVAAYDAGIAYTDAVVGRFLAQLRERGVLDHAIVVIFSDHGEAFWEHGAPMHGLSLYDEEIHVPLFIRLPGADPPRGRVERQVALADVFATAIDLSGLDHEVPADSKSLRPLWEAADGETYERTQVTSELVQTSVQWLMLALRSDRWKYISTTFYSRENSPLYPHREALGDPPTRMEQLLVDHLIAGGRDLSKAGTEEERRRMLLSAREELFHVGEDPKELRDLVSEDLPALEDARASLKRELVRLSADAARIDAPLEPMAPLSEEEKEGLRALGYVQ